MSNNVMWLVNKRLRRCIAIAKYYPGTGWYSLHGAAIYDPVLDEVAPKAVFFDTGPTDWEIQYDFAHDDKEIDEDLRMQIATVGAKLNG